MPLLTSQQGPYASAVLRFGMDFPLAYPSRPPQITFTTDIFHPLVTPLTTSTGSIGITDVRHGNVTDQPRRSSGCFRLAHGFPGWVGESEQSTKELQPTTELAEPVMIGRFTHSIPAPAAEVLRYVRSTFDSAEMLDSVPLAAAGNPSAWHAWQAYRRRSSSSTQPDSEKVQDIGSGEDTGSSEDDEEQEIPGRRKLAEGTSTPARTGRSPAEWDWDGVWEERAGRSIRNSTTEAALYGNSSGSRGPVSIK